MADKAKAVDANTPWDYLIIGSGFGGSVSALRLVEKGYRVLMLEKGRRFAAADFPTSNWQLNKWLWLPAVGWRGIFQMSFLRHVTVFSGVGVGGGSLVYGNTLPIPGKEFFNAPSWASLAHWEEELAPHYATAQKMLGATINPLRTGIDDVLSQVATDLGRAQHFSMASVAVYFGEPGKTAPDPYFGGKGPPRAGCTGCGGCLLGCRFNAKNTLDKNYLYLAEALGLHLLSDTEVTWVKPHIQGGYEIIANTLTPSRPKQRHIFYAQNIIFAGGVMGTLPLLLRLKNHAQGLPRLSPALGSHVRTNSEALLAVTSHKRDQDWSQGVAISSILHTDAHSHVEPVRYSAGSGFFRLLALPHVSASHLFGRLLQLLRAWIKHPWLIFRSYCVRDFAKHTIILLFMRTLDGHLRLVWRRPWYHFFRRKLATQISAGSAPTPFIPEATDLSQRVAAKINGQPLSLLTETLFGIPSTAHILGGCSMGRSVDEGVIDHRHRAFGYNGLYVIDGSAVSANPGVNPSLTIVALAERALGFIPEKRN